MKTQYLNSKPHYEILDGLRGVAAIIVLIYHLCEGCGLVLGHGYLGVDFFYALSGFVIGFAYDDRWDRMTVGSFLKRRIVRLHPMLVMGGFIGLCLYYFGQGDAFPYIGQWPWWMPILIFLYTSLMLPMPNSWDIRGWQDFNSLNGNSWSLYWEYLANLLYALFLRFLPTAALALLTLAAAMGTIDVALNVDIFGLLNGRLGAPFTVNGGWSLTASELYVGAVRLLFPFLIGLLMSRLGLKIRLRGAFTWCSLMIAVMFLIPQLGGIANGIYEAATILVFIPIIVSLGAGSSIQGKYASRICQFLGDISYPLYITHLPLIYMQIAWMKAHPDAPLGSIITLAVLLFIASVAIAYASLKLYDIPVRKWLTEKWLKK